MQIHIPLVSLQALIDDLPSGSPFRAKLQTNLMMAKTVGANKISLNMDEAWDLYHQLRQADVYLDT